MTNFIIGYKIGSFISSSSSYLIFHFYLLILLYFFNNFYININNTTASSSSSIYTSFGVNTKLKTKIYIRETKHTHKHQTY